MRLIGQEIVKIFRLRYVLLSIIIISISILVITPLQKSTMQLTHTEAYPNELQLNSDYSIEMQFQDFLLDHFGSKVTMDDLNEIQTLITELTEQIEQEVNNDWLLKEHGYVFQITDTGYNYAYLISYQGSAEESLTAEEQAYIHAVNNGVKKYSQMDYPVGFVGMLHDVINEIHNNGIYHVLGTDLIYILRNNLLIVCSFVLASITTVIPYGVSEKRSLTERLTCATKVGRSVYFIKITAVVISAIVILSVGILISVIWFSQWEINRYHDSMIDTAMNLLKDSPLRDMNSSVYRYYTGLTYVNLYVYLIVLLTVIGIGATVAASLVAFSMHNTVSAYAFNLPIMGCALFVFYRYVLRALDYYDGTFLFQHEPYAVLAFLALITLVVVLMSCRIKIRRDIVD